MGTEGRTRTWAEWAQEYQVYIAVVLANWTAWIEGILKSLRPKGPQIGPAEPVDVLEVAEGFKNRVVLLTGASGYLGSLILELLLRTCPDVAKVYVIMRAKAGRNGRERLLKILQGPLFQKFHSQLAEIEDKVVVITADLTAPGAGLTPVDRARLASEVHYIIHCAADIRFTLNLVESLRANYAPTQTLLELAAEAPKLRCFTYVSTAYVNSDLAKGETVKEILYADAITRATKKETNDATRARVLDLLMKVNQTKAATQSAKLLKASGLANPYMLAKNFTERLVMASDRKPFPVCIVRPSGIGAVAREPYPGYIGNPSGLTAFILAAAAGAIKASDQSAYSPSSVMGLVPAECVSSTVLAATIAVAEGAVSQHLHTES